MDNELNQLLKLYFDGTASEAEISALMEKVMTSGNPELEAAMRERWEAIQHQQVQAPDGAHILAAILEHPTPVKRMRFRWYWAAAIMAAIAGSWLLWQKNISPGTTTPVANVINKNPVLVLDDGSIVQLDSTQSGIVSQQGNTTVTRSASTLSYQQQGSAGKATHYNTLKTPRGSQFKIVLPDGTNVWLNAASSITYPTAFNDKERKVTITGEAYFEVTAASDQPFTVTAGHTDILVLGTRFNVNAYEDEKITRTTLLQGAVLVRGTTKMRHLLPGQQAITNTDNLELVTLTDADATIAWKNGNFSFKEADVQTVMRELARWYDVDITYSNDIPTGNFTGEMSRSLTLEQIVQLMEQIHIHLKITNGGKGIIVVP